MKYYTPLNKQLTLDLVRSSLDNLDKSNRWVQMGDHFPWADIEKDYNSRLDNKDKGAGNKPTRMVVDAIIVKHKLSDTAKCWTGMCYFVKNEMTFLRKLCHILTEIWQII